MKTRTGSGNKPKLPAETAPAETAAPKGENRHEGGTFPIVGIGASAGGLEALELFLQNVPAGSGMAFVIVQHLDPTHKGIMVELLQRATAMKVVQVRDRMKVEPDQVYVIPPNKDMSILHGTLHLLDPAAPRGLRLPIDFFFRSLADDRQDKSIGVILSGMGSDGTLGLRAIKEKAGAVFVQAPESAKFDGMPRSAIDAGLADVVAPAEELPGRIIAYLRHAPLIARPGRALEEKAQSALEKVFILLRTQTGQDFSLYKKSTVYRRIERRMGLHQIDRIATYVRFLQENPQETELLFKELLIGVTGFFRDPAAWEHLKKEVIPALLKRASGGRGPQGLDARLLHGGGGLFPGHRLQGGPAAGEARRKRLRSRSSPPTWTRTPSTRPGRGSIRPTSPRTFRRSACAGSSSRRSGATGWARRSARWWSSPPRTSSWTPPSPSSTSWSAGTS